MLEDLGLNIPCSEQNEIIETWHCLVCVIQSVSVAICLDPQVKLCLCYAFPDLNTSSRAFKRCGLNCSCEQRCALSEMSCPECLPEGKTCISLPTVPVMLRIGDDNRMPLLQRGTAATPSAAAVAMLQSRRVPWVSHICGCVLDLHEFVFFPEEGMGEGLVGGSVCGQGVVGRRVCGRGLV